MRDPNKVSLLNVIFIILITIAMTTMIVGMIFETTSKKDDEKINNLEALVEYHQQQTFELLQEWSELKRMSGVDK